LKFSYDEPGIEFTPAGEMIFPESFGEGEDEQDTSEADLAVAQFIDGLLQSMDFDVEISWDDTDTDSDDDLEWDDDE